MVVVTSVPDATFVLPFLMLLLCAGCFLGRAANALVTYRWTVIIGGMCYTLYLYHATIIDLSSRRTMALASQARPLTSDLALQCLLLFPLIFVACALLFVLVEKPFMGRGASSRTRRETVSNDENRVAASHNHFFGPASTPEKAST